MSERIILHRAEEEKYGQSRPYEQSEAVGLFVLAILAGLWAGLTVLAIGAGYRIYTVHGFWLTFFILAVPAGVLSGGGLVLVKGIGEQLDGLRSYETRQAESYAPPQPELAQLPSPWRPPVPIRTREGTTLLDMNERPMLPDPQAARQITPPVVAEILKASIEEYGGQWSRRKLMRLRVLGQKVTRGMYEELTSALHQCGILQQNRQGGFELPHDVESFEDLAQYLPSLLELGGMGGGTGRDGNGGGIQETQSPSRGEIRNLAERHRLARMQDLDHSVRCYLQEKGVSHD